MWMHHWTPMSRYQPSHQNTQRKCWGEPCSGHATDYSHVHRLVPFSIISFFSPIKYTESIKRFHSGHTRYNRGWQPMALGPDLALLTAAFVKKNVKTCKKMLKIWLSQPKSGSFSQKGCRPLRYNFSIKKRFVCGDLRLLLLFFSFS